MSAATNAVSTATATAKDAILGGLANAATGAFSYFKTRQQLSLSLTEFESVPLHGLQAIASDYVGSANVEVLESFADTIATGIEVEVLDLSLSFLGEIDYIDGGGGYNTTQLTNFLEVTRIFGLVRMIDLIKLIDDLAKAIKREKEKEKGTKEEGTEEEGTKGENKGGNRKRKGKSRKHMKRKTHRRIRNKNKKASKRRYKNKRHSKRRNRK